MIPHGWWREERSIINCGFRWWLYSNSGFVLVSTGYDTESWGLSYKGTAWHGGQKVQYCEPFFDKTTVIGCHLNLYKGTLAFSINGTYMGVAFTGVNNVPVPLYPIVSSTASETELGLGEQFCRYLTLQEKCLQTIKRHLEYDESVESLPLPKVFKSSIKNIWQWINFFWQIPSGFFCDIIFYSIFDKYYINVSPIP